jgi:xylose isomerase
MPVKKAIEINAKALRVMNERVDSLPHEKLIDSYLNPHDHRGNIELVLIDSMMQSRETAK